MKIDFNQILVNPVTELPFEWGTKDGKIVPNYSPTLKDIAIESLSVLIQGETLPGVDRFKRGMLAATIYRGKESVDLTVEEISLLKDLTGKLYPPLTVAAIWQLLENPAS